MKRMPRTLGCAQWRSRGRFDLRVGEVGVGDDRVGEAAGAGGVGEVLEPGGLLHRVGHRGLEVDRLREVLVARVGEEVREAVALADRREVARRVARCGLEPGVVVALEVPEVVVGVDDPHGAAYSKTWCAVRLRSMRSQS
jgi:hypothetical protein